MKAEGGKIGNSLCEEDRIQTAIELIKKAEAKGVRIHLPSDSVIADKLRRMPIPQQRPVIIYPMDGWALILAHRPANNLQM